MRPIAIVATTLSVVVATGCGASGRAIDTRTVLTTLKQVGFSQLKVRSNKPQNVDWIYMPGYPVARVEEIPVQAARFGTVSAAKRRYANDQPLLHGRLTAADRTVLPPGFQRSRLREQRVCNVVLTSYNPAIDATLTRRFSDAVRLLQKHC